MGWLELQNIGILRRRYLENFGLQATEKTSLGIVGFNHPRKVSHGWYGFIKGF